MNLAIIKEIYQDYEAALKRLKEGVRIEEKKSIIIDGVIQRFEFTFELSWKLMRAYLGHQGIECNSPRSCIKAAYQFGLIKDGDGWVDMLEDRNKTSYIYDEKEANTIYKKIKSRYTNLFSLFLQKMKKDLKS